MFDPSGGHIRRHYITHIVDIWNLVFLCVSKQHQVDPIDKWKVKSRHRTIARYISELKNKDIIERKGPDNGEKYEINDIEFTIEIQQLWNLFLKQPNGNAGKKELTNLI